MYERYLQLNIQAKQSAFLWGARKTGKSTFLKTRYPESVFFDLLNSELKIRYGKEPWRFREEILALDKSKAALPIIVDEIQKVPALLDEIHWLIENAGYSFIMCGSSSRQMKRAGVNLLGGRALKYHFFPLVFPEIRDVFNLVRIFNNGLLPSHYILEDARDYLRSYLEDYLIQEIQAEGLARNLDLFSRFFDSAAFSHGEMLNYSNIARDVGIASSTVKEYYQILIDTLIGYLIYPYRKDTGRDIILSMPKFYLFDVGLASRLVERRVTAAKGIEAGRCLEHYVFLELLAYIKLNNLDYKISYWHTKTGLEVDFILHSKSGKPVPVEVKISGNVHKTELKGLRTFLKENEVKQGYVVSMETSRRLIENEGNSIVIYPLYDFLDKLWGKELF